jgi:hypothetical protein
VKTRILLASLLVTASATLFAGGSDGPSHEELWEGFYNPLADYPVEETLSGVTIRSILAQLGQEQSLDSDSSSQWQQETSFHTALTQLLEDSGRKLSLSAASTNEEGCLHILVQYRAPHSLFTAGLESGHEDGGCAPKRRRTTNGPAPATTPSRWRPTHAT